MPTGDRALLGGERDLERERSGRRGGGDLLVRRLGGDLRGGGDLKRLPGGGDLLLYGGGGERCRPTGLPRILLGGDLIGERRRRRKGDGERRRGDAKAGRLRGGESAILLRGDTERLRGGGEGDRPLRGGGESRRREPSFKPSRGGPSRPMISLLGGGETPLFKGGLAFFLGTKINCALTMFPSIWPPSICANAFSASTLVLNST